MFDSDDVWTAARIAAVEEHMRVLVEDNFKGRARVLLLGPDGRVASPAVDDNHPGLAGLRGLLEAGAGHLAAARAAEVERRRQAAVRARELALFAAQRPSAVLDRPEEEVGAAAAASRAARPRALTAVSEWAVDEVMVALGLSAGAASGLLADSVTLAGRLPATLAALEAGRIGWDHARAMAELVAPVTDAVRARVEERLLARAEGKTVAQLRVAARRAVLSADAAAAASRLARAIRDRGVRMFPGQDGMGSLAAVMALPVAQACRRALQAYAEDCRTPGDQRTLEQAMVDCLADLILRPGINPPVQIGLTVVAGVDTLTGGDEPGEVDGQPVPAVLVRELAHTLGLLPRPDPPDAPEAPEAPEASNEPALEEGPAPEEEPAPEEGPGAARHPGAAAIDAENHGVAGPADSEADADDAERADPEAGADDAEPADPEAGVPAEAAHPEAGVPAEPATPAGAEPTGDHADPGGPGGTDPGGTGLTGQDLAALRLADLLGLRSTAGTPLAHLPMIAIVEEISGQLLALTDATQIRHTATCGHKRCRTGQRPCTHPPHGRGLGPPPDSPGYSPSVPLDRFVRARDRRCRFPGCRAAAIRCDLDHNTTWPAGATGETNLCCLCRHHHRLSHQAPGWTMTRLPDGGLRWTTPGGDTLTTHPPRYGSDDDLPPPKPDRTTTTATARAPTGTLERLRRWPPPPADPDHASAPF